MCCRILHDQFKGARDIEAMEQLVDLSHTGCRLGDSKTLFHGSSDETVSEGSEDCKICDASSFKNHTLEEVYNNLRIDVLLKGALPGGKGTIWKLETV